MPSLIPDRRRAALVFIGLAILPPGIAVPAPANKVAVSAAGGTLNVNDDAQSFEKVVISRAPGTVISADRARGSGRDYDNSHWVLAGKVHVEHDNAVLDADAATVVFANGLVKSIEVHGKPAKFFHPGKVAGQRFVGTADTINFDGTQRQVHFSGGSWFSRAGVGEGNSGKPLLYEIASGALRSEAGGDPDAPVQVVFGDDKLIEGKFDGSFSIGTDDETVAGEQVTITKANGTRITAAKAQGKWSGTVADSRWNLSGKVHIDHDQTALDADTASVVFANQLIQSIDVQGAPARFTHPGKTAGRPYNGSADAITYDGAKRLVRFTGHSWFSYGPGEGNSRKPLIYDLNIGALRSEQGDDPAVPPISGTISKERVPAPRTPDRSSAQ